ncbi:MAG: cytochrome c family protein [Sphingomonadaceae bacterium]|jgi:cytochrome c|nr:cytochrome c family protein [Sphingomonadaceae bacterium]
MDDRSNTFAGWVLGSGIVALGFSILSGMYFNPSEAEHEGEEKHYGYAVAVAESGGGESGPSLAELLAAGDAEAGKAVFAKCTACHTVEQGGKDGTGPNLFGIMGKPIGKHAAGFAYSSALSGHGGDWSWENMDAWLTSPRKFADGTKMSFAGLSKPEDRVNLMLYLETMGGAPAKPVVEEKPAEGEEAAEGEASEEGAVAEAEADQDAAAETEEATAAE